MKKIVFGFILLIFYPFHNLEAQPDKSEQEESKVKIGVYDSRVVAYAFSMTKEFSDSIIVLTAKRDSAQKQNDRAMTIIFDKTLNSLKGVYYRKIFSTYPVDDILSTVIDEVKLISENAGVSALVSKWEMPYVSEGLQMIDLTKELSLLFADSAIVAMLYPPEGIPKPKSLVEAEVVASDMRLKDSYDKGNPCSVVKNEYKSDDFRPKMVGLWRASDVYINGSPRQGMLNWYFLFHENGVIEVEEFHKYVSDGEWLVGLNENVIVLKLTDDKKSLAGRYDFRNNAFMIAGKGFTDPFDYVCIVLRKVEQ